MVICPACKQHLKEGKDKNGKPYFLCDECGVLIFIRGRPGIRRYEALKEAYTSKPEAVSKETRILEQKLAVCPACREELEERRDKRNKPYFVCDECGVQIFIRGQSGIWRYETLKQAKTPQERQIIITQITFNQLQKEFPRFSG